MTEGKYSAEKDLLKLIENPGEIESQKAKAFGGKKPGFSLFKPASKTGSRPPFNLRSALTDRRLVLRLLFLATFCVFVYFVVTVAHEYSRMKNAKNLVKFTYISQGKEAHTETVPAVSPKPEGENAAEPDSGVRNIFKPPSAKKEEEKKDEVTVALSDYRLVGISIERDPKDTYVMVKNVKTNITFFLKKNEWLNGMEILNILDNKVVLKVKGKEVELR